MKGSIDIRVRLPLADIVDAMADEVAREVERQVAPFVRGVPEVRRIAAPASPSLEEAIDVMIQAVTRLDNSIRTRDEQSAMNALHKAAIALRRARKEHLKKEVNHV